MITAQLPLAILLTNPDGSPMTSMELFKPGGPIMWPILVVSFLLITVAIERMIFIVRENRRREPELVDKMLEKVESNDIDGALELGRRARIVAHPHTRQRALVGTLTKAAARSFSASARVCRLSTPASPRPRCSVCSVPLRA